MESELTEPWYDTLEGLSAALERGLPGLHEIGDARRQNYGEQHLQQWIVLGRFILDSVGNFSVIINNAPAEHPSYEIRKLMRGVIAHEAAFVALNGISLTSECAGLPSADDHCDRCHEGWSLRTAHDVHWDRDWKRPRHHMCNELAVVQEGMQQIHEIVAASGIVGQVLFIPNRYWPKGSDYDDIRTPWAIVQTDKGLIRIGWRKRVFSIEWGFAGEPCSFTATGPDLVGADETTTESRLVHAWGTAKAIEYLQRLWISAAPNQPESSP